MQEGARTEVDARDFLIARGEQSVIPLTPTVIDSSSEVSFMKHSDLIEIDLIEESDLIRFFLIVHALM